MILFAVVSAMVLLPVGAVWWSCRVAPPVKPPRRSSFPPLAGMFAAAAKASAEFEECWRRVNAVMRVTGEDVRLLREAMQRQVDVCSDRTGSRRDS